MERQPEPEPPAAPPEAKPARRRSAAPAFFAAAALAAFAGAAVASASDAPEAMLLAMLASETVFACGALGATALRSRDLRGALRLGPPSVTGAEIAALVAGFVMLSHALSLALAWFSLRETGTLAEIDQVVGDTAGPSRLLAFVAIGLAPAIGEELLFRGFVQQAARPRFGTALAIAISAAAFAAIHLDPVQSPAAFALGLYLGSVVEIGGGLRVAILCHAVNNSLAVFGPPVGFPFASGPLWALVGTMFGLGLLLLAGVARRARWRAHQQPADPPGASTLHGVGTPEEVLSGFRPPEREPKSEARGQQEWPMDPRS